jgi:hydrogenase maturation protein HypF
MRTPAVIQRSFTLPLSGPPVMATGSQQQNTLSITSGDQASLSRTLGNLDSPSVCIDHEVVASEMIIWQGKIPAVVACDRDPDFYSTRFAIEMASRLGVPNQMVQHHHAHVAAVCVENLLVDPVIGVVLDDRGLGSDGHIWGGELLLVECKGFTRLGHLAPIAMPGGGIVLREPWRMGAAALHGLKLGGEIRYRYQQHPASLDVAAMLDEGRSCPLTSCAAMMIMAVADLLQLDFGMQETDANSALEAAAVRYFNGDYRPVSS